MRIEFCLLESSLGEVAVILSDGMARPGEMILPKRGNMFMLLF